MDAYEKKSYLFDRINDIRTAYLKFDEKNLNKVEKSSFPEGLKCYNEKDLDVNGNEILKSIEILKFIDVAKKEGLEGWDLSFDNRPEKYVVFKKLCFAEYIRGEGLTAYLVRYRYPTLIFNSHEEVKNHPSTAFSNHKSKVVAPICHMLIGFPLFDEKNRKIGVLKIEKYSKPKDILKSENDIKPKDVQKSENDTKHEDALKSENDTKHEDALKSENDTKHEDALKSENDIKFKDVQKSENKCYNYDPNSKEVLEVQNYIPLLVRFIKSAENVFHNNSYSQLFKGKDLLENLKKIEMSSEESDKTNKIIYDATLHLFLVLKRNEFIGYDEILTRITHYVMRIGNLLGLKIEMTKSFEDNLERFRKHEELLLSGLNNYRDHFIHQFHVFVSGYIIINELGIDIFRSNIEKSMLWILRHNDKYFSEDDQEHTISEADVLRIWFLASFYHDYAYILQKLDRELENFFDSILGYKFSVEFNWEELLTSDNNFSKHICDLLKYFSSKKGTNTDTLLQNYLNAIIKIHDHGVLGALLLIRSAEKIPNRNFKECMYAALAISLHNPDVYKDLKEGEGSNKSKLIGMSFESFPIAFLLAFCDTAQTFGRLETKHGIEASKYPVRFFGIEINKSEKVTYKLAYLDSKRVPSAKQIKEWAHSSNEYFTSLKYSFVIEHYEPNEKNLICALYF